MKYAIIVLDQQQLFVGNSSLDHCCDMLRVRAICSRGPHSEALEILNPYLAKDNPEALYLYSYMPSAGEEFIGHDERRVEFLKKSAESDYPVAVYVLGAYLDMGDHMNQDKVRAAQLFKKAASMGHAHSKWIHGMDLLFGRNGIIQDQEIGIDHIQESAQLGFVGALDSVAGFYESGDFGYQLDLTKAKVVRDKMNTPTSIEYTF